MSLFRKVNKTITPDEFWQWFIGNKTRLEDVYNDPSVFDELMAQAQRYSKYIEFLIGKPKDKFQLFVSCNGIRDGIPAVKELVEGAPNIKGWGIIAFKQPVPLNEDDPEQSSVIFDNQFKVDAITASFALNKNGDLYDLTIFSPKDRMEQGHEFAYYLLLDMLLGEYFVMTKLGVINIQVNDEAKRPPLIKLPDYLDTKKNSHL